MLLVYTENDGLGITISLFEKVGEVLGNGFGSGFQGDRAFKVLGAGGGYVTEFVIFRGSAGQTGSGLLRFFSQDGQPMNLTFN